MIIKQLIIIPRKICDDRLSIAVQIDTETDQLHFS